MTLDINRLREIAEDASRGRWRLRLTCCARDDGAKFFASWDEADAFRESYVCAEGHDRAGVIEPLPIIPADQVKALIDLVMRQAKHIRGIEMRGSEREQEQAARLAQLERVADAALAFYRRYNTATCEALDEAFRAAGFQP